MPAPKGNKYAQGNSGGRPPAYTNEQLPELGKKMEEWFSAYLLTYKETKEIPFIERFAREVADVSTDTLNNYCEQNEEFFVSYKRCKEIQKQILIMGGLGGLFNPTAFIFTAKNITDMRDKIETDITSKGEKITITGMQIVKDGDSIQDKE